MDKTTVKALRLFEYLCRERRPVGVTELAGKLRLTKSNTHRSLRTLISLGYVQQLENGLYQPTLKAWELGTLVVNRLDFLQIAQPHLKELNDKTGECVYLATLDNTQVVYLAVLESRFPIQINAAVGGSAPPHCSASGKLLLAYNAAFEKEYLAKPLMKFTARTTVRSIDLARVLEKVREAGYAVNDGEWLPGVCGVAAPVHNNYRKGLAAIGITGLTERINRRALKDLSKLVTTVALRISHELGYRPAS